VLSLSFPGTKPMFNVRPDIPWIYVRPDQFEESPPGFRVVADPGRSAPFDNIGFGSFGRDSAVRSAPINPVDYPSYNPSDFRVPSRYPTQGAFDQLARIYGLSFGPREHLNTDVGSIRPVDGPLRLPDGWLNDPLTSDGSRVGNGSFTPLSHGSPLVHGSISQLAGDRTGFAMPAEPVVPQNSSFFGAEGQPSQPAAVSSAVPRLSGGSDEQVLSDATSDDGLRDGQQYVQYRRPSAIGGMRLGVDDAGRDILVPDERANQPDPLEKLRQRGYPKPPDDPGNGSAAARELREKHGYGQHRPHYHRFEFKDPLCDLGTPGCSIEAAYDALLRHALPGGDTRGAPIQHEQVSPVSLQGVVPGGRVQTFLDRDSGSVIHHTMDDHLFRDGYLQRQIVEENGKIYVRTFGEGNNVSGDRATANNIMVRPAFEDATARIRAALRPLALPTAGQKWPR
jgi:hypothetical protein